MRTGSIEKSLILQKKGEGDKEDKKEEGSAAKIEERKEFQKEIFERGRGLEIYLREISFELKENGFPVGNDCRIDMDGFEQVYSRGAVESDKKRVAGIKEEFALERFATTGKRKIEVEKTAGGKLEMFKTAIFHKLLKEDFFVLRSSIFDDTIYGVDNVIIDRETGNLVCGFDEVVTDRGESASSENEPELWFGKKKSGERKIRGFKTKKAEVFKKNQNGGAELKYGLKTEKEGEKTKITLGWRKNFPIFYLALPRNHLENGIKKFNPFKESNLDKTILNHFFSSIKSQISELKLHELGGTRLNPNLKKRLDAFEKKLEKLSA